jgi:hypothetical protein
MTGTPLYEVWKGMKARCGNPNHEAFKNYGGRGIAVCSEWYDSFENFYKDMRDGYSKGLTLERVDTNKGYYKENCRWASRREQMNNMRKNVFVETPKGTMTIAEAARAFDLPYDNLHHRVTNSLPYSHLFTTS